MNVLHSKEQWAECKKKLGSRENSGSTSLLILRFVTENPSLKETRKLVRDCIEMAATGLTIDELASRANLPREAIVEALHFAAEVLQRHYTDRSAVASRARERLSA